MPTFTARRLLASGLALAAAVTSFTLISTPAAGADPSANDWSRLRTCEASGNYRIIDPSGTHFGAYQFDQSTWNSVGGQGRPDLNSPAEQDYRALYLYRMRGWQPWQCADAFHLRLQEDRDARSGRIPTRAESAYMGGGGALPPPPNPGPPPGPVPPPPAPPVPPPPAPPAPWVIPPAESGVLVEFDLPLVTTPVGACSPVLALWQLQMNNFGYGLNPTGCNDAPTRTAAHQLQYQNGIQRSDNIGLLTLVAAYLGRPPR